MRMRRLGVLSGFLLAAAACGGGRDPTLPPPEAPAALASLREEGLLSIPPQGEIPSSERVPREALEIETGPLDVAPTAPFRLEIERADRYPVGLPRAVVRYGWSLWGLCVGGTSETGTTEPVEIPLSTTFSLLLSSGARRFPSTLTRETFVLAPPSPLTHVPGQARGMVYFLIPPQDPPAAMEFRFGAYLARRELVRAVPSAEIVPLGAGGYPAAPVGEGWILARAMRGNSIDVEARGEAGYPVRLFLYDAGGRRYDATAPILRPGVSAVSFPSPSGAHELPLRLGLATPTGGRLLFPIHDAPLEPSSARILPAITHEGLAAEVLSVSPGRVRVALLATTETPLVLPVSAFSLGGADDIVRAPRSDEPFTLFPFHRVVRDLAFDSAPAPGARRLVLTLGGVEREVEIP